MWKILGKCRGATGRVVLAVIIEVSQGRVSNKSTGDPTGGGEIDSQEGFFSSTKEEAEDLRRGRLIRRMGHEVQTEGR